VLPNAFREPDRHLRADAGLAVDEVVQRLPGDAENLCAAGHRQAQRLKTIMPDDPAGMHGVFHGAWQFLQFS